MRPAETIQLCPPFTDAQESGARCAPLRFRRAASPVLATAGRRRAWNRIFVKKRRTFMIEPDVLDKLRAIKDRTGLSESEQVRQGIQWWLESREWPPRKPQEPQAEAKSKPAPARSRKRR